MRRKNRSMALDKESVERAARHDLQLQRLEHLEVDLAIDHGAITPEVWPWAEQALARDPVYHEDAEQAQKGRR